MSSPVYLSPVAPVDSARSDPARSTRLILLVTCLSFPGPLASFSTWVNMMDTTVCALDDVAFICVAAIVRCAVPDSIRFSISSYERTTTSLSPTTCTPSFGCWRIWSPPWIGVR